MFPRLNAGDGHYSLLFLIVTICLILIGIVPLIIVLFFMVRILLFILYIVQRMNKLTFLEIFNFCYQFWVYIHFNSFSVYFKFTGCFLFKSSLNNLIFFSYFQIYIHHLNIKENGIRLSNLRNNRNNNCGEQSYVYYY